MTAAIQETAKLLVSCRCPVISVDSDIHGCRSVVALAERVGATYDHVRGSELAEEAALFTDHGGFFTTPLEARRRADLIVLVGEIPAAHHELLLSWHAARPDLGPSQKRRWFHISGARREDTASEISAVLKRVKASVVEASGQPLAAVLAAVRAGLGGRKSIGAVEGFDDLAAALGKAAFPVFVFSGRQQGLSTLAMLQGLVGDLNRSRRATSLFLPSDDRAWGLALASVWMTGFPPRTGFGTGKPVYDPQLSDVTRMITEQEADLHLWISEAEGDKPVHRPGLPLVAFVPGEAAVSGAAVTITVGRAGVDHDGVFYSSRMGTLSAVKASAPSYRPSVSGVLRELADALPEKEALPC
ncbi:formylmethanofuran dehydrogenase subunit B [Ciceribacter lividus]|uniref:Formylmethanofuran dehydrogenase subunit B n=1 Tax=Ciceribacter lividus TaxID=1197950 RepID=A0A6I7HIU2_9HYPH|nr:formylmethanofuran dehydrogenase subunit B [Ciceribacter lividus]